MTREETRTYNAAYRAAHKEGLSAYHAAYRAAHKERALAYGRAYYAVHKEGLATYQKAYQSIHREEIKARSAAHYAAHKKEHKAYAAAHYVAHRSALAGRPRPALCEVCGGEPGQRPLHFDHDHKTDLFRGWLCSGCNQALGNAKDNPDTLEKLAAYLRRFQVQ